MAPPGLRVVFPLGAFYLAYPRSGATPEAKADVRAQLAAWSHCERGLRGQRPSSTTASPSTGKGCLAQAWSVGEILKVYESIR